MNCMCFFNHFSYSTICYFIDYFLVFPSEKSKQLQNFSPAQISLLNCKVLIRVYWKKPSTELRFFRKSNENKQIKNQVIYKIKLNQLTQRFLQFFSQFEWEWDDLNSVFLHYVTFNFGRTAKLLNELFFNILLLKLICWFNSVSLFPVLVQNIKMID